MPDQDDQTTVADQAAMPIQDVDTPKKQIRFEFLSELLNDLG